MPYFQAVLRQSEIRTFRAALLIFGVRPHECQIGSGEEFRSAVRLRHSRAASDFLASANHSSSSDESIGFVA
jgi:hypothetical protein